MDCVLNLNIIVMWTTILFNLLILNAHAQSDSLLVQVEQGLVRGHREGNVFSFFNVPYATAPTGPNRYKAPLPPPQWEELDAVDREVFCPQPGYENASEDCLVANIFVPDTTSTNLPVMVVVHGGGFFIGAGQTQRYTNLVSTEKLIVVTFNYRLGVPGYLCLGTKDIPGNAGMKDQIALLRWVKRNIANFGGNPNDITINGCSAGGASVELLTLSPMATGLFNKVISSSGSGLGPIAVQLDPVQNAKDFAKLMNFDNVNDIDALEEFYKTVPTSVFAENFLLSFTNASTVLLTPCVEAQLEEERFLSDAPWNIITKGGYPALPILYGFAEIEGTVRVMDFGIINNEMNNNFAAFLPIDLQFVTEEERQEVANRLKQIYFGENPIDTDDESLRNFLDYYSDMLFVYPILRSLNLRRVSNKETVYLYEYSYLADFSTSILNSTVHGAEHCAHEIIVVDRDTSYYTPQDLAMRNLIREMVINFVITGAPSAAGLPPWPAVSSQWAPYMSIQNQSEVQNALRQDTRLRLWEEIYLQYPRHPAPPSTGTAVTFPASYSYIIILTSLSLLNLI